MVGAGPDVRGRKLRGEIAMKKLLGFFLLIPSMSWATYIPVNGSTVTANPPAGLAWPVSVQGVTTVVPNSTGTYIVYVNNVATTTFNGAAQPVSPQGVTTVVPNSTGTYVVYVNNVSTVTFNGSAQPVSLTGFPLVPTGVNASTVAVINQTGSLLYNYQIGTSSVSFNGISQPVSPQGQTTVVPNSTGTYIVYVNNVSTVTFNGAAQPVSPQGQTTVVPNSTGTYVVYVNNVATATFNGVAQPVSLTGFPLAPTGVNASTVAVINQAGNNLNVNIAAGSIANTGFNVNNTPTVETQIRNGSNALVSVGYQSPVSSVPVNVVGVGGSAASVNADGGINVHTTNGAAGGTSSNFASAFPAAGTAAGFINAGTGNMGGLKVDSSSTTYVYVASGTLTGALPSGTNTLGTVYGYIVNVPSITFNGAIQPVAPQGQTTVVPNSTGTYIVYVNNVSTITFNGTAQPISLTGFPLMPTGVNASTVAVVNQTGTLLYDYQIGTSTMTFNGVSQPVSPQGVTTVVPNSTATWTVIALSTSTVGATASLTPVMAGFKDGSGNTQLGLVDASGFLKVNIAAGGAAGGTSSNFASAFPGPGTAVGFINSGTGNMGALKVDSSSTTYVYIASGSLTGALPSGTNTLGTVYGYIVNVPSVTFNGTAQPVAPQGQTTVVPNSTGTYIVYVNNVATTTFNGVGQPVNATQTGTWTVQPGSNFNSAFPSAGFAAGYVNSVNGQLSGAKVDFSSTSYVYMTSGTLTGALPSGSNTLGTVYGYVVNVPSVTFNGTAQPVAPQGQTTVVPNSTGTWISFVTNIATVTFNGVTQPVAVQGQVTTVPNSTGTYNVFVVNVATTIGSLSNNGAAAGTNRLGTLPGIAQNAYGNNATAFTQGRDAAGMILTKSGLLGVAELPDITFPSFSASTSPYAVVNTTADIGGLCGNAISTVAVYGLRVSCTETTAGVVPITVVKRSTAYSSLGNALNFSTMTAVAQDSSYSAANSTAVYSTVQGFTNGTAVAYLDGGQIGCLASGTAAANDIYVSPADWRMKPIVLRGPSQCIGVNFQGASITGGKYTVTWDWMEASTP
jgi:hypothetical protein